MIRGDGNVHLRWSRREAQQGTAEQRIGADEEVNLIDSEEPAMVALKGSPAPLKPVQKR